MRTGTVAAVSALLWMLTGCGEPPGESGSSAGPLALPSGELDSLVILDIAAGEGEPVKAGDTAVMHYTGWLYDASAPDRRGGRFDGSSRDDPFEFLLGAGRVIDGWDLGIEGMKVGGRRYLFIPPSLAYGARSMERIPSNSTLFFDVELLEIK